MESGLHKPGGQPLLIADQGLASLTARLDVVVGQFVGSHMVLDLDGVMDGIDADYARSTTVADSEFGKVGSRLGDVFMPPPTMRDGIYTADLVDQPVGQQPGNPKPRYPDPLRAAGIEAAVDVFFVVDTTGRVDEPSITFANHVHTLFMDAIRASLRHSRFFPARLSGAVVPQVVQQEFLFELHRRP